MTKGGEERGKYTSLNWGVDCTKCVKRGKCSVRGGVAQKCDFGAWNETLGMVLEQARQVDPLFANRVSDAHNQQMAAKDKEIESLKDENTRLRVMVGGASVAEGYLREEIERLRALVKELSKIVDGPLCHQDCALCPPDTRCASKRLRALVAKAREVCNV